MKKFLVLFVGLAILAGSVCALDLPDALKSPGLDVSGNVRTGFRVTGYATQDLEDTDGFTSTPKAEAYSDDPDDGHPIRAQLVLQWTKGNLGVKTRFRWQPDGFNGANLVDVAGTVNKAFVWGDVLDKKVRVTAGRGLDGTWEFPWGDLSPSDTGNFDDKDGLKVEVKPIDGLNLGVFYGTDNLFATGASDRQLFKDEDNEDFDDNLTGTTDRRFVAGVKYGSDKFGLAASLYWNPTDVNYDHYTLDDKGRPVYTYQDSAEGKLSLALPRTSNLLVGGQVKATDALTVNLNLGFSNLGADTWSEAENDGEDRAGRYKKGDYNPYTFFHAKLNGEYAASDALSVGLTVSDIRVGSQYYYDKGAVISKTEERNTSDATLVAALVERREEAGAGQLFPITITPSVGYAINDDIDVGGELGFKINQGGSDQFGFKVKPSATFKLGSGASFTVYDQLTFYTESKYARENAKYDSAMLAWRDAGSPAGEEPGYSDYVQEHPGVGAVLWKGGHGGSENTFHIEFSWSF
jgi:hypothetical protein